MPDAQTLNCPMCGAAASTEAVRCEAAATATARGVELEKNIRYVPCPVCHQLMNRVNFAHCSNVIVDVCAKHGTWFDKDELRCIVEFIRSGCLEQARFREMEELEERRRRLKAAHQA